MANITLRQSSGNTEPRLANVSISNTPLTNVQLDNNFNNLNNDVNSRLLKSGGEVTGNLTISGNTIINTAIVSEVHTNDLDLQAVSTTLHRSPNAITAMFLYDTSKDSDGGAWTEKCQHTSWYNEPLSGKWLGARVGETDARCVGASVSASEPLTNGDFSNGTTGWTTTISALTVVNGVLNCSVNSSASYLTERLVTTIVGKVYFVSGSIGVLSGSQSIRLLVANNAYSTLASSQSITSNSLVPVGFYFTATETSTRVVLSRTGNATSGESYQADNISIREVTVTTTAANDYFQLTSDGKFYALSKNLLTSTATLATQTQWLTAGTYTLSSTTGSSGSVAVSGAATASHTAGTPTTFTVATSGNVTFTVTGSVLTAQCELGSVATTYSANASTTRYNEVFRGNKRSFPKVAAIVGEYTSNALGRLTIYDLTEPSRPMWMQFNGLSVLHYIPAQPNILAALNGQILSGNSTANGALNLIDFVKDKGDWITQFAGLRTHKSNIAGRSSGAGYVENVASQLRITNNIVNAVAMTVLPDAPVDHCLVGSTLVSMADGSYKRIDEVVVGDLVNTLEGVSTVKRWLDQGIKNTITLTFDNGTTLTCTPDHQIRTTIGWIEAQYLTEEHEIIHE